MRKPGLALRFQIHNLPQLHGFQGSIVDIYDTTRTPNGAYMVFNYALVASKTLVACLFLIATKKHYVVNSYPTVITRLLSGLKTITHF